MSKVHVLGGPFPSKLYQSNSNSKPIIVGSIGSLLAYHLQQEARRPVQLILRNARYARDLQANHARLTIKREGIRSSVQGLGVEWLAPLAQNSGARPQKQSRPLLPSSALTDPISTLVVATKSHNVVPALKMIKHRLNADTTIVLVQNGFGLLRDMSADLFTDPDRRPSFVSATTTHGAYRDRSNNSLGATWAAVGSLSFAALPSATARAALTPSNDPLNPHPLLDLSANTLPATHHLPPDTSLASTIQALLDCHSLKPIWLPYPQLRTRQLKKVVVNVCINSLGALLNVENGMLLNSEQYRRYIFQICKECEAVFKAQGDIPPDASPTHSLMARELFKMVVTVTAMTGENICSTLADLRGNAEATELDVMNGYFTRSGRALNVPTPTIDMLADLVQMRLDILNSQSKPKGRTGKTKGHARSSRRKASLLE